MTYVTSAAVTDGYGSSMNVALDRSRAPHNEGQLTAAGGRRGRRGERRRGNGILRGEDARGRHELTSLYTLEEVRAHRYVACVQAKQNQQGRGRSRDRKPVMEFMRKLPAASIS